jgi:hypothetical protein
MFSPKVLRCAVLAQGLGLGTRPRMGVPDPENLPVWVVAINAAGARWRFGGLPEPLEG